MKNKITKRIFSLMISAIIALCAMPVVAFAQNGGAFILVAEADGQLIIPPVYVAYTQGQTIKDALLASPYSFSGIEDGMVDAIDGVVGEFTRSDENGSFSLDTPAADIEYYRFSEESDSRPSAGLMLLMKEMADYANESSDVKAAAKEEYETAYNQFVGLADGAAAAIAQLLSQAVEQYKSSLSGESYAVNFVDGNGALTGGKLIAQNPYGRQWSDESGAASLMLPEGSYTFVFEKDGLSAKGDVEINGAKTVAVAMPNGKWLKELRLSGSYGGENSTTSKFTDDEFTLGQWDGRQLSVPVMDTFTGTLYANINYDNTLIGNARLSAIYACATDAQPKEQTLPFDSFTSGTLDTLKTGAVGNSIIYRISTQSEDGIIYAQDYTVEFKRVPTLCAIAIKDQRGVDQAPTYKFNGTVFEYDYKVLSTTQSVTVDATGLFEEYSIKINGQAAENAVAIELNKVGTTPVDTAIEIEVTCNGQSNVYTVNILPGQGKNITFVTTAKNVEVEVINGNGVVMPYERFVGTDTYNRYRYTLVTGDEYSYVATRDTYHHVADSFTLDDIANNTVTVDSPDINWLEGLSFGRGQSSTNKGNLPLNENFDETRHTYTVNYEDTEHLAYIWAQCQQDVSIKAMYKQLFSAELYHNKLRENPIISADKKGTLLNRFLMDENPWENTLTLRLTKELDGVTYYQDYIVEFKRNLSLKGIDALCDGSEALLIQNETGGQFDPAVKEYTITVPMAAKELELNITKQQGSLCYGEDNIGYKVFVNGDETEGNSAKIRLDGTIATQTVTIRVENEKAPLGGTDYRVHVLKSPPVETAISASPADAVLMLYRHDTGEKLYQNESGKYELCEGFEYDYAMTLYGYVSKSGKLSVERDDGQNLVIKDGSAQYSIISDESDLGGVANISWALARASENSAINADLTAQWPDFRGDKTNNGVVDVPIPTAAEDGTLYWAVKLGNGFDKDAVGSPIIVDGDIVTYAKDKIYRIDKTDGTIKASGTMDHKSSFSITPPVYAEGMVFVALSNGCIQAFNAVTLESLWIYEDFLGGQPNCPLTVHNGYLYTGFWNAENKKANFVCLSITDEDLTAQKEAKCASWFYTQQGGFYWAGAYVNDDYLIVGTDDGSAGYNSKTARLLLLDPKTGEEFDTWEGLMGDMRSTVVYDDETDAFYFTTKGGIFCGVKVEQNGTGFIFKDKWSIELANGVGGVPMSTCSPAVYNGRAYIGVSGAGQFTQYSGHNITVIDILSKRVAYSVQTQGYPQTSGLLTTAYEQSSGYVYVYFFDNMTPGKLRLLRDKPNQTAADLITVEGSFNTAYALFTPTGDQAQYAICSPIADEYGTIYFKNDSAYLMAYGSAIISIEVTELPDKLNYAVGESFDPNGMRVVATLANGQTKDVTEYVTYNREPLEKADETLTITFEHIMYHNAENGAAMTAGINAQTPVATIDLTIGDAVMLGDVNGDGVIDLVDAMRIAAYFTEAIDLTAEELLRSDVNGDGGVDLQDAMRIAAYFTESIDSLN